MKAIKFAVVLFVFLGSCKGREAKEYLGEITPGSAFEFVVSVPADGDELVLSLNIATDSTSWDLEGRESVVLTVYIDEEYNQDMVLFSGKDRFDYGFITGPLTAGEHKVKLEYATEKSPAKDARVYIYSIYSDIVTQDYLKYSPVLYGRPDTVRDEPLNSFSDAGLVMFVEESKRGADTVYTYSLIWSNEDGGTGVIPPLLMAQYGRTTDIEWVYEIELAPDKSIVSETFQKVTHTTTNFTGQKLGLHPLLVVQSNNNNMEQDVTNIDIKKNIRYALVPVYVSDLKTREEVMDANPWIYRIANQEMERETILGAPKMENPGDPTTSELSDYRNYLFLEFNIYSGADVKWRFGAQVNGVWYYSDHDTPSFRYTGNGWGRSAIELPAGTKPEDITNFSVEVFDIPSGETGIIKNYRCFMLGQDFIPIPDIIKLSQEYTLDANNPKVYLR